MGNSMVTVAIERGEDAISNATLNQLVLPQRVNLSAYPAVTSDVVALMVFDHQGHAMNLLTRLGWETRIAQAEGRVDFSSGELAELIDDTARYLLFVDEPPLPSPVRGVSRFADVFRAGGTRDRQGRSLRELDLQSRMFKHRCSYMIYSPAFDALPKEPRAALFERMREVLIARGDTAVLEILDDTRPGWR
jgi:hypothetical protein